MSAGADLCCLETIVDTSGLAQRIEALLAVGVRARQLQVRTLLIGILAALADGRPAHLVRVHRALLCLSEADKLRLQVIVQWKSGPHELTYRQVERTFSLAVKALAKEKGDGRPAQALAEVIDALLEASVQVLGVPDSSSYAIDWSDYESFARPPHTDGRCADAEAAWGHRKTNHPGKSQTFFGYYLQTVTIAKQERGPGVPEFVRRIALASCEHDPPAQITPVLQRMVKDGIALGDLLADSGYSYREAQTFACPARAAGAQLVVDLHPNDRGMKGTHEGAVIANGNLYCPATPEALLQLAPPAPCAKESELEVNDQKSAELARHKFSALSAVDADGYQRVLCPAAAGRLRCPHKPSSMTLSHERPTIGQPPQHPPTCCAQQTITVPPAVNAKTAQKHDYPSKAHRRSYARRTASERSFSQVYDPASNDISRGWCRLMGLTPNALMLACVFVIANIRTADAFAARRAEDQRRAANGLEPRRRRRRRKETAHGPLAQANAPPLVAV